MPWEIARPTADKPSLADRHLLVRVVHDMAAPATQPVALGPGEPLRVLFVFAEARGSRPLAARRERRELLRLFEKEIYPKRRVVAHFLTHGVTRERLEAQIQETAATTSSTGAGTGISIYWNSPRLEAAAIASPARNSSTCVAASSRGSSSSAPATPATSSA